jgi:glc operon protein GlcG
VVRIEVLLYGRRREEAGARAEGLSRHHENAIRSEETMNTDTVLKLTLEGATKVLNAALEEARKRGKEISVAVVDAGGHPLAFARTDKASLTTITVAQNKARCAAFTAYPTGKGSKAGNERSDFHALAITLAAGPENMVTMQGGVPIVVKGQCVGGVAVSGAGHSDGEIAQAGAAVVDA